MIISSPENKYEKEIADIISNKEHLTEGVKSILYDLVLSVKKIMNLDYRDIDLNTMIEGIEKTYHKVPNIPVARVLVNCINYTFPDKIAKTESSTSLDIIISDRPLKIDSKEKKNV